MNDSRSKNKSAEDETFHRTLQKARVEFLFNNPFLSVLSLSLTMTEDPEAGNLFETDGRQIFVNPVRSHNLKTPEILHLYGHVILHIALRHALRGGKREKERWNLACDIAVESLMDQMPGGWKRPSFLREPPPEFRNRSAEEIYEMLPPSYGVKEGEEEPSPDDLVDSKEETSEGSDTFNEELDAILLQARAAASRGPGLPGILVKEIDQVIQPEIRLEEVLRDFLVASLFEKIPDFRTPSRKHVHRGLYLPGMAKAKERLSVAVALDSSASVSKELYKKFLGVVARTCQDFYEYSILILPFDDTVRLDLEQTLESLDDADSTLLRIPKSDGGTDLAPLLDHLDTRPDLPDVLLVLTDGRFEMKRSSPVETIFLVTGDSPRMEGLSRYGRVIRTKI